MTTRDEAARVGWCKPFADSPAWRQCMAPGCTWTSEDENPEVEAGHLALHDQHEVPALTVKELAREAIEVEVASYIEIGYRTMVAGLVPDSTSLPAVEQMRHLHLAEPHLPAFAAVEKLAGAGLLRPDPTGEDDDDPCAECGWTASECLCMPLRRSVPPSDVEIVDIDPTGEDRETLRVMAEFRECVRVERDGDTVMVPVADLRIAYRALSARPRGPVTEAPAVAPEQVEAAPVTAEQIGHVLSEWLDDHAPLHERRYVAAAEHLATRFPALGIEVRGGEPA